MDKTNKNTKWKDVSGAPYRWLPAFNTIMREEDLPMIEGDTIYVASDYSGFHKQSRYTVISLVLADLMNCREWEMRRSQVRKRCLSDGRRMSFKNLGDRKRREALIPFLEAAGSINGLCACAVVSKEIGGLVTSRKTLSQQREAMDIKGKWNIYEFERMARVAHFVALFTAGIVRPFQNIVWISDDDQIMGNSDRKIDCARLVSSFTSLYVKHELGELSMGTTSLDEGDRFEEDFASIADLVAGSLSEIVTHMSRQPEWYDQGGIVPRATKNKSNIILAWLTRIEKRLRHVIIVFESLGGGSIALFPLEFT